MKLYTVLLLRPDYVADNFGQDTYMAHVEAESVPQAQTFAQVDAVKEDFPGCKAEGLEADGICPRDYLVLAVIWGIQYDIKETS